MTELQTWRARPPGDAPQVTISCLIATTRCAGGWLLSDALRATGLAGDPRDYFDPFAAVKRGREWGLSGSGEDFAARYLSAVAAAATGDNGALSVNLPWPHQRWLARLARAALPDAAPGTVRSEAEVLEAWFPQTRYLYLTRKDTARQAASWYLGRRTGSAAVGGAPQPGQPPDFQEVRWIETLISRQKRAWEAYFQVHSITAHRVEYEAFLERPEETLGGILRWLGVPGSPGTAGSDVARRLRLAEPVSWLADYVDRREQLSETIGVRRERG